MFTIIETSTNKVLFAKYDDHVLENQTAIDKICTLENPQEKDVYFDWATETFYLSQ